MHGTIPDRVRRILDAYRKGLAAIFGEDLVSVLLYGSLARGEAVEGSDIDILCVLKRPFNYGAMIDKTSEITAELSLEHDVVLSRAFITVEEYEKNGTPFLMNVHKEQIPV